MYICNTIDCSCMPSSLVAACPLLCMVLDCSCMPSSLYGVDCSCMPSSLYGVNLRNPRTLPEEAFARH